MNDGDLPIQRYITKYQKNTVDAPNPTFYWQSCNCPQSTKTWVLCVTLISILAKFRVA